MSINLRIGDCRTCMAKMPDASVQCVVTSPPYFGLRDYGRTDQIGMEPTPAAYVAELVAVFREVWRVLRNDGTLWLNLGDSYAGSWGNQGRKEERGTQRPINGEMITPVLDGRYPAKESNTGRLPPGLKPKDLIGIPWRVAFALQADGWYLRSDIIWHKPNPMPESVRDRPTKTHEYLFLLSKSERYYYDADAIAEPANNPGAVITGLGSTKDFDQIRQRTLLRGTRIVGETRNARSVWTMATQPFTEAHFAVMPPELAERCIKAGSKPGDTVLDPFAGAGTTLLVADRLGRNGVGVELNPQYVDMAERRIRSDSPLFVEFAA